MTLKRSEIGLRHMLGVVSIGKAKLKAGLTPMEPTHMFKEKSTHIVHGTPAQGQDSHSLQIARPRSFLPSRQYKEAVVTAKSTVREAVCQMSKVFKPHVTPQAITLTLAIAYQVEEHRLLTNIASCVVAAACAKMAAGTLSLDGFLGRRALQGLGIPPGALRVAYNNLWYHKKWFFDEISKRGGDFATLPVPRNCKGEIDMDLFRTGMGLPPRPQSQSQTPCRRPSCAKGSPLKSVLSPAANA